MVFQWIRLKNSDKIAKDVDQDETAHLGAVSSWSTIYAQVFLSEYLE